MERLYKTKELADYLGVTTQQIYVWSRLGELPTYHLGKGAKAELRFSETDVKKWLESNKEESK